MRGAHQEFMDDTVRVAVLTDIGRDTYHVGDEAIAHAIVAELTTRGLTPVLVTHDPAHTAARFPGIATIRGLEIDDDPTALANALRAAALLARGGTPRSSVPRLEQFVREVGACDSVLVGGGGNLSSSFGSLLYERIIGLRVGQVRGLPTAVSGQTVGPALTPLDGARLALALAECRIVGLRDAHSVKLVRRLVPDTPAVECLDDASWCGAISPADPFGPVVCTFGPLGVIAGLGAADFLARELDAVAETLDAEVILLPHKSHPVRHDEDENFARQVVAASKSGRLTASPIPTGTTAAERINGARLVITSRYHPIVFALARDVPVLALAEDGYARVRMDGVLRHWGFSDAVVPLPALRVGELAECARSTANAPSPPLANTTNNRAFHKLWWDAVAIAIRGVTPSRLPDLPVPHPTEPPDLVGVLSRTNTWLLDVFADRARLRLELRDAKSLLSADRAPLDLPEHAQEGAFAALVAERDLLLRRLVEIKEYVHLVLAARDAALASAEDLRTKHS